MPHRPYRIHSGIVAMTALFSTFLYADDTTPGHYTANVILVTIDGLRWQEVFGGADQSLLNRKYGGVREERAIRDRYWQKTAEARRQVLMPFFWGTIQPQGVVYGNPARHSQAQVTNPHVFSYPGYNEILTGYGDPRVDSNEKTLNPNITVLEWLHQRDEYRGRVQVFASWNAFPFIINTPRSGIPVNAGWPPPGDETQDNATGSERTGSLSELDEFSSEIPHPWDNVRYDYFTFRAARESLQTDKPRVLYVAFGETDNWAHEKRYDLYLDAAHRVDAYIERLWTVAQEIPQYAGKTSLLVTTDHGRGNTPAAWRHHRYDVPGSKQIWIAVLGPDVLHASPADSTVTQSQVAATVAALLGEDYYGSTPESAAPLPAVTHKETEPR